MRILKSMPIVVMNEGVKLSSLNRRRQHDLPTPLSPIKSNLIYSRMRPSRHVSLLYSVICRAKGAVLSLIKSEPNCLD